MAAAFIPFVVPVLRVGGWGGEYFCERYRYAAFLALHKPPNSPHYTIMEMFLIKITAEHGPVQAIFVLFQGNCERQQGISDTG